MFTCPFRIKLHPILAVANLLAHNNKSHICYCGQISLQSAAVICTFSDNLTTFEGGGGGVTYILLAVVHIKYFCWKIASKRAKWIYFVVTLLIFEYIIQNILKSDEFYNTWQKVHNDHQSLYSLLIPEISTNKIFIYKCAN